MSELQTVIKEAKSALDKGYVFIHVKDRWLRTLLDAVDAYKTSKDAYKLSYERWKEKAKKIDREKSTMKHALFSDGVYKALKYYQKQGLCEGDEYSEIDKCFELIDDLECVEEASA